jgi:RNA polymerase sigma-70 factor, ECF subfamily
MAGSTPLPNLDDDPPPNLRLTPSAGAAGAATRADLERLYRSHFGKFTAYFRRCGQSEAVAHELVQETFVQALRNLKQFDGRAQLSTWVWAIARNELLAHVRKKGLRVPAAGDAAQPVDPDTLMSSASGRLMEQCECVRRGFASFANLHPERAQVLYLAVVEGWTRDELAAYLGRTVHAATEYLSQSRAKLKPYIAGCDDQT